MCAYLKEMGVVQIFKQLGKFFNLLKRTLKVQTFPHAGIPLKAGNRQTEAAIF